MIAVHIKDLLQEKARQEKRRKIPLSEVSAVTGLHRDTLKRWMDGKVTTYSAAYLVALCQYFGCGVGDILSLDSAD